MATVSDEIIKESHGKNTKEHPSVKRYKERLAQTKAQDVVKKNQCDRIKGDMS